MFRMEDWEIEKTGKLNLNGNEDKNENKNKGLSFFYLHCMLYDHDFNDILYDKK